MTPGIDATRPTGEVVEIIEDAAGNLMPERGEAATGAMDVYITGGVPVSVTGITPSASIVSGVLGLTTAPALLPAHACSAVTVQADPANTTNCIVGAAGAESIVLAPGQSLSIPLSNSNILSAKAASGTPNLNWITRS